ncbi:unnamed protein product [Lampetra planeri]
MRRGFSATIRGDAFHFAHLPWPRGPAVAAGAVAERDEHGHEGPADLVAPRCQTEPVWRDFETCPSV